ncbi:hypothetical protein ABI59_05615 [Acidobacteria bacterium Mor1]|nr:hypothetical protein ABI59_05615 [Acidobacteria bacterium Mor1]
MARSETSAAPLPDLPPAVRFISGFYYFAALVGVAGAVSRTIQAFQGGAVMIALPIGVGMSAWAIGRGLRRGSRRSWWWARLFAGITPLLTIAFGMVLLFVGNQVTYSTPFGPAGEISSRSPWLLAALLVVIAFWSWQFWSLTRPAVKQIFLREASSKKKR